MGATNGYMYRVILQQAVLAPSMGYAIAIGIAFAVVHAARNATR